MHIDLFNFKRVNRGDNLNYKRLICIIDNIFNEGKTIPFKTTKTRMVRSVETQTSPYISKDQCTSLRF